ncbi:MAG: DUF4384 domain-containing protein [Gemmatimonadota bacterium]|nr:DUF4384 domain-containing protein [Gemmatimonadota bacterium]
MRRPSLLFLTFGWFFLFVSTSAAQPDWATQPPSGSRWYLYGVGIAHATGDKVYDRQRADDVARTDIARQLRITVTSRLTSTKVEDTELGYTHDTREVIESSVSLTLEGVAIKERHYDKIRKIYYALAQLNRQSAAERIGEKIQSAAHRAGGYLRQAEWLRSEETTYQAFLALLQAAEERAAVELDESIYRALATNSVDALLEAEGLGSLFSPSRTEIDRHINEMVTSLAFSDIDGNRQTIDAGRVEYPLSARLITGSPGGAVKVSGFPVQFVAATGRVRLDDRGNTDKNGFVSSNVYHAGTCIHPSCKIVASVDTTVIRAQAPGNRIERWIDRLGDVRTSFELLPGIFGIEDGVAELACRLMHTPSLAQAYPELSMVVARFTYQDTRIAGPFTGPLRRLMHTELATIGRGRVIEQVNLSAAVAGYGDPNVTETIARAVRADVVVWGDYWEQGDSVVVNARMTGVNGARLASATIAIPREAIPYTIRPPVLDPDIPEPPPNGIPIKIWTERGDGGMFVEGERLTAYVQAGSDCYLRLLYRQVDGQVIQIFPNRLSGDERVKSGQVYSIPDTDDAFDYVIKAPFGVEYLISVASATPFPRLQGREINGGVVLPGTMNNVIQRLIGGRTWYGQALCSMTTVAQ